MCLPQAPGEKKKLNKQTTFTTKYLETIYPPKINLQNTLTHTPTNKPFNNVTVRQ